MTVEVLPVHGLPEVEPGDDLVELLTEPLRAVGARAGDVVAVTQKIVSKAEGRLMPAGERARWVERETAEVVARRGDLVIARTHHGFVCANAGVDASNVPAGVLSLLPEDPDRSAEGLRAGLERGLGSSPLGVVVTDTFGRPWREGVVDVAIGCAGLAPLVALRGTADDRGRPLETTVVALADAIAAASGLVMTKTARVPAAVVRGVELTPGGAPPGPARALVRPAADDLFRRSPLTAAAAPGTPSFGAGTLDRAAVEAAVETVATAIAPVVVATVTSTAGIRRLAVTIGADAAPGHATAAIVALVDARTDPGDRSLLAGMAIGRLAVALGASDVGGRRAGAAPSDAAGVAAALGLEDRGVAAAVLWVGPRGGA